MWLQRHAKFSQRIKISWCRIMTALTRTYSIYDCLLQYSVLLRFCITKEIWKIWVIPPPIVLSICKLLAWWCAYKIVRSAQRWSKWRSDVGRFFFFFRRAGRGGGSAYLNRPGKRIWSSIWAPYARPKKILCATAWLCQWSDATMICSLTDLHTLYISKKCGPRPQHSAVNIT